MILNKGSWFCPVLLTTDPWPLLKDDSLYFGLTCSRYGQLLCNQSSPWGQSVCQSLLTEKLSPNPHLNHLSYTLMHRNSKAVIPSGPGWNVTYRYAMALSQETCQNKPSLTSLTRHTGSKEAIRDSKCPKSFPVISHQLTITGLTWHQRKWATRK